MFSKGGKRRPRALRHLALQVMATLNADVFCAAAGGFAAPAPSCTALRCSVDEDVQAMPRQLDVSWLLHFQTCTAQLKLLMLHNISTRGGCSQSLKVISAQV